MEDLSNVAQPGPETAASAEELKHKYQVAKGAVADLAGEARQTATHYAGDLKDHAADWVQSQRDAVARKSQDLQESMSEYVQKNPYRAVAIAAGVGFIVGLVLKRR